MGKRGIAILILLFFIVFLPIQSFAVVGQQADSIITDTITQVSARSSHIPPQRNKFSLRAGYGFHSFRLWGKTPDTQIGTVGVQYNRRFLHFDHTALEYTLQLNAYTKYSYPEYKYGHPRNSLSGFGIIPLGFQSNFFYHKSIQPFINSSAGFMILNGPFPDSRGKKFNFTFRLGAGMEFMISKATSLSIGLQYYHLSNGNRGLVNPGIDSGMIYSAFSIF